MTPQLRNKGRFIRGDHPSCKVSARKDFIVYAIGTQTRKDEMVVHRYRCVEHLVDLGINGRDEMKVLHRGHLREAALALWSIAESVPDPAAGTHPSDVLAVE